MWVRGRPRGKGWFARPGLQGRRRASMPVEGKVEVVRRRVPEASKLRSRATSRSAGRGAFSVPRPRLALTVGDPAGIGPEIVLRALASSERPAEPVVFGSVAALADRARASACAPRRPQIRLVDVAADGRRARLSAAAGRAAAEAVLRAAAERGGARGCDGHGAAQQGVAPRRRPSLARPHRDAGGGGRRVGRRHDVRGRRAARRAAHDPSLAALACPTR